MKSSKNIPKIRFKGFTKEWEERELNNEVDFFNGLTYSPSNIVTTGGTLVLRSSNVQNGEITTSDSVFVSSDVVNCDNVKLGDIIVVVRNGSRSLIGKHAQVKKEMKNTVIGAFMTGIRSRQPSFLNSLLSTSLFYKEVDKNLGATINQITNGAFKKMYFMFPKFDEQEKIGEYFKNIDSLIELRKGKLEKVKNLKKALLAKMFPIANATTPTIRFKNFTDNWQEKKLGDLCEPLQYGLNAPAKDYDGINKYIRITDIDDNSRLFSDKKLTSPNTNLESAENYKLENGDILFARTGASVGKSYKYKNADGLVYYAGFLIRARVKPHYSSEFIFQNTLRCCYENFIKITSQRSGQPGVNAQEYSEFTFKMPRTSEQQKIGELFTKLDTLIGSYQQEIEKLKNIKQSCLAKMFVA